MTHKVFSAIRLADQQLELIAGCEVRCHETPEKLTAEAFLAAAREADGILSPADQPIPVELLKSAPRLRVISNVGVGYDNVDLQVAAGRGIMVTNTPGVLSAAVAELTMGLMVTLARGLREAEQVAREGRWGHERRSLPLGTDLRGKTLGIVGFGRIGREVAARALAFGMRIVYYDARDGIVPAGEAAPMRSLEALLREADFVTVHTDLNPESHHLIGPTELGQMKRTSYLINTARGAIVDQAALYAALKEGRIAGAALDVLEQEPPDPADPLQQLPNVYIVPHIGSATRETRGAMFELAVKNLLACLNGEPCDCVVSPDTATRLP